MSHIQLEGIVIRADDHGETDRLITFVTKDRGKKRALAKGAKKITSRRNGHLDVLNRVSLLLHKGKLLTITQCSVVESFSDIKNNLKRLSWAMLLCQLTDKLVPEEEPEPHYYDLLLQTCRRLAKSDDPKPLMEQFSFQALHVLGYLPKQTHRSLRPSRALMLEAISSLPHSDDLRDIFDRIH